MRYHLEKRSKRSWTIVIDMGKDPVTNTRKRRYIAVEGTKAKAEAEALRILAEMEHGTYVEPSNLTLGQWLTQWLKEKKPKLAPRTYESYEQMLRLYLIPALGSIPLQKLTASHISAYEMEKLKTLSPRTVAYTITILSSALKKALQYKLIKDNPANYIEKPKYQKNKFTVLSEEQAAQLLDVAARTRYYPIILTAIYTGMRMGEIIGLKWEDVDLDAGTINVQRQLQLMHISKEIKELGPKDDSYGVIPLPEDLVLELKKLRNGSKPSDYVFTTSNGTPYLHRNLHRAIKKIAQEAGFPDLRPHDLRHTCASILLAQGVPLANVKEILRHKDAYTTATMYTHPLPHWQKEAAERLAMAIKKERQDKDDR